MESQKSQKRVSMLENVKNVTRYKSVKAKVQKLNVVIY